MRQWKSSAVNSAKWNKSCWTWTATGQRWRRRRCHQHQCNTGNLENANQPEQRHSRDMTRIEINPSHPKNDRDGQPQTLGVHPEPQRGRSGPGRSQNLQRGQDPSITMLDPLSEKDWWPEHPVDQWMLAWPRVCPGTTGPHLQKVSNNNWKR